MRVSSAGLVLLASAAALAGCGMEPGAPLVSLPSKPATVLPSEVPAVRADDGFPVILSDPVAVAGLPLPANEVAAEQARLEAVRVANEAEAARLARSGGNAAALAYRGRTHVAETRALIEASGRPQTEEPPREVPAAMASPVPRPLAAAEPIDPTAAAPRSVGAPAYVPTPSD